MNLSIIKYNTAIPPNGS